MSTPVTLRRYVVRGPNRGWAIVVLGSDGYFSALSDWGGYAYMWTHHGHTDFREFFLKKDFAKHPDYMAEKLGRRRVYDGVQTFQGIARRILSSRRSGYLSKEEARKEWNHFEEVAAGQYGMKLRDGGELSQWDFRTWHDGTSLSDAGEAACHSHDPQAVGFVTNILPLLADAIQAELAAEQRGPAGGAA
jgi:hypothetical protein